MTRHELLKLTPVIALGAFWEHFSERATQS